MKKMKEFASEILENILTEVVLAVEISLAGIVYAFYTGNSQLVLQIISVILIAIDIVLSKIKRPLPPVPHRLIAMV